MNDAKWFIRTALLAKNNGAEIDVVGMAAQAILETGWGSSELAVECNNYFGIKASRWSGETVDLASNEWSLAYGFTKRLSKWRVYQEPFESFMDYAEFLQKPRYQKAIEVVRNNGTTREYIQAIKDAGYATDPDYVSKIMGIIGRNNLESIYRSLQKPVSLIFTQPFSLEVSADGNVYVTTQKVISDSRQ